MGVNIVSTSVKNTPYIYQTKVRITCQGHLAKDEAQIPPEPKLPASHRAEASPVRVTLPSHPEPSPTCIAHQPMDLP